MHVLTSAHKGNCHMMTSLLSCQHEHQLAKGTTMGEAAMVALFEWATLNAKELTMSLHEEKRRLAHGMMMELGGWR